MVCETQLYDLLLVAVTATTDQIAKSYKKLALKYHPDKTNHDLVLTEKFKEISHAYEILKDSRQRGVYDAYGMKGLDGSLAETSNQRPTRGFNPHQQSRNPAFGFQQAMFSLVFADMSSVFGPGSGFARAFSQPPFGHTFLYGMNISSSGPNANDAGSSTTVRPDHSHKGPKELKKGTNIHHSCKVSLADMYHGKQAKFLLPKMTRCSLCQGVGGFNPTSCMKCEGTGGLLILVSTPMAQIDERRDCPSCRGIGIYYGPEDRCERCDQGYTMETTILEVTIPPGSKNGDKCILVGQSDEGKDILPGDVIIHVEELPQPFLVRRGNDLFMEHDIDLKTALLGGLLVILDFPRTGEDIIVYVNVHGRKSLNDSVHPMINAGEVVGTINLGVPKIVKGLGMPINESIKDGTFYQGAHPYVCGDVGTYLRGDLYIKFNVQMPELTDFACDGDLAVLLRILPDGPTTKSFGTLAWEHHLSNVPVEPTTASGKQKSASLYKRVSPDCDYEQLDIHSQDGSEQREDTQYYTEQWIKEQESKRRKVDSV